MILMNFNPMKVMTQRLPYGTEVTSSYSIPGIGLALNCLPLSTRRVARAGLCWISPSNFKKRWRSP